MINVVAAIIKNEGGKILIAKRNLKKSQGGLWEFPGGKIEKDEDPKICGIREMFEETGCTSDNIIYLGKLYPSPGIMDENGEEGLYRVTLKRAGDHWQIMANTEI